MAATGAAHLGAGDARVLERSLGVAFDHQVERRILDPVSTLGYDRATTRGHQPARGGGARLAIARKFFARQSAQLGQLGQMPQLGQTLQMPAVQLPQMPQHSSIPKKHFQEKKLLMLINLAA